MKFKFLPIFVLLLLASRVFAQERTDEYERSMKTAGFWIGRHPSPDAVIMGPSAIDRFNARLRNDNKLTKDIFSLSGAVIGMAPRYGLVVHYASQRFLPNFDPLQNSALDAGTPAAVVHTSADGRWYYVMTSISDGWVEAKNIALGDIHQVMEFAESKDWSLCIMRHI